MSVLERLGSSLTKAVRKLLRSPVVDEAVIKELVRDFQRALLQADVNVQLVLDLSKEIERRALGERLPPGISRREHVVKVVYEALTRFLGEKPAKIRVKAGMPNVLMLVGIQGSGKCVVGNAKIFLASGEVKKISELFREQMSCRGAVIFRDGVAISPRGVKALSVNIETLEVEEKPVEWIWRLEVKDELYEVELDYGVGVKVTTTPEHPFFTINGNTVKRVRADCLEERHHVMVFKGLPKGVWNTDSEDSSSVIRGTIDLMGKAACMGATSAGLSLLTACCLQNQGIDGAGCLEALRTLSEVDVSWARVRRVRRIKNHDVKYVYDLTVKDNHNFIANGIVVNNTTSAAKLARYFQKRGFKSALVCADAFRLGAFEQLKQLADGIGVPIYGSKLEKDAIKIAVEGVEMFRKKGFEVIILDTAGRHKDEKNLIKEMREIAEAVKPDEVILVIDATIGQQAHDQAQAFHEATSIGSIFLAKLDGSARGGGALSAVAATGVPIKFIGVGEGVRDIEIFVPSRFVGRLLGMGDLEGLVQKVREAEVAVPEKKVKAILRGKFTLMDMYEQIDAMSSMGHLKRVLKMIPGMGYSVPDDALDVAEDKIKRWKYILQSMTKEERENPKIINSSRIRRIARGSGTREGEVKSLIKQYFTMRKLMRSMGKRRVPPFLRRMLGQIK